MQNIRGVYVLQENCKKYIKVNQTVFSRIRVESTTAQQECTYLQAHPVESFCPVCLDSFLCFMLLSNCPFALRTQKLLTDVHPYSLEIM